VPQGIKDLLESAEAEVTTLEPAEVMALRDDPDVTLVDLRDVRELQWEGRIPNSFHAPRGMLEFWIDPESPYHKEVFSSDKRFVFCCNKGWRSALGAQTAQRLGLENVAHLRGGLSAWQEAGGDVEPYEKKA